MCFCWKYISYVDDTGILVSLKNVNTLRISDPLIVIKDVSKKLVWMQRLWRKIWKRVQEEKLLIWKANWIDKKGLRLWGKFFFFLFF